MSTYDAYTLSMRDSTEFTVPTGGSGVDSDFSIAKLTIDASNFEDLQATIMIPTIISIGDNIRSATYLPISANNIAVRDVILYKGKASAELRGATISSLTGAATENTSTRFTISGDCTLVPTAD